MWTYNWCIRAWLILWQAVIAKKDWISSTTVGLVTSKESIKTGLYSIRYIKKVKDMTSLHTCFYFTQLKFSAKSIWVLQFEEALEPVTKKISSD